MRWIPWLRNAPFAACCLLAASIPLPFIYSTVCIWILIGSWILGGDHRDTLRDYFRTPVYLCWLAYFALFACGYFHSENEAESIFDTVGKLSFVLLPLLAGSGTKPSLNQLGWILLAFIGGVTLTGTGCVVQAWHFWSLDGDSGHFFYHELPRGLDANAVYMAWYVIAALAALLLFPWKETQLRRMHGLRWILVVICSGLLLLLAARMLLAAYLLLVLPAFGLRYFLQHRQRWAVPLLAMGLAVTVIVTLAATQNPVHRRFSEVMHPDLSVVTTPDFRNQRPELSNLTLRLLVWRVGMENMERRNLWLLGAGNGDVHRIQNERFAELHVPNMTEHSEGERSQLYNVNLHNMYLQTLITTGVPGLLLLLVIVLAPFFNLRKSPVGWLCAVFHIICIFFLLQESALQTQAGVVFYCFFYAILFSAVKALKKEVDTAFQKR